MSSAAGVSVRAHEERPYAVKALMRVGFLRAEVVELPGVQARADAREGDRAALPPAAWCGGLVVALLDSAWRVPEKGAALGRFVVCVPRACVVMLTEAAARLSGAPLPARGGRPGLRSERAERLCFVRIRVHRAGPDGTAMVSPVLPAVEVGVDEKPLGVGEKPAKVKKPAPKRYEHPWLQAEEAWRDFSIAVPHAQVVWGNKSALTEAGAGELLPEAVGCACDVLEAQGGA